MDTSPALQPKAGCHETPLINSLNQYTTNSNPAQVQIVRAATATASVTVNGVAAYERLEYFHEELTITNSSAVVLPVTSIASLSGTYATNSGSLLVHPATQVFKYDADGNLTNDLVWEYFWDAENRLSVIQNSTNVTAGERLRLEFGYTWENKRFAKKVFEWNAGTTNWHPTPRTNLLFLYDGWKLIAEIDNSDPETAQPVLRSYAWGLDIAESLDEAAGVGGLLLFRESSVALNNAVHFGVFDGNGNVTGLVLNTGQISAQYEYDPFGKLLRVTGGSAEDNPLTLTTKFRDRETGLTYFGHRYLSAQLRRWLNRDPIEEEDSRNLYEFTRNSPIDSFDALGLTSGSAGDVAAGSGGSSSLPLRVGRVR